MDWVKLASSYYNDPKVAALPDADCEVMFLRSIAYCGLAETGGFVAAGVLLSLGRRGHKRCAAHLVTAGLWEPAPGGWHVVRWGERQAELMKIVDKRRRDADRKRRDRGASAGTSADSPRNVAPSESESESESDQESVVKHVSRPQVANANASRLDDDVDIEAISKALGGCDTAHAESVAVDILSRSTTPPDKPTGYILRSIGREPDRYKPTFGPDRAKSCEHGRKFACGQCREKELQSA